MLTKKKKNPQLTLGLVRQHHLLCPQRSYRWPAEAV